MDAGTKTMDEVIAEMTGSKSAKASSRMGKKVAAKSAKTPEIGAARFEVSGIDTRILEIGIKGVTPLIVHAWSKKALRQMADAFQGKNQGKQQKPPQNPAEEFLGSLYTMDGRDPKAIERDGAIYSTHKAGFGIPAACFRNAMASACANVDGIKKKQALGALYVLDDGNGLVKLHGDDPRMREDCVRLHGRFGTTTALRYRGEFENWSCRLRIRYNARIMTPQGIANLLNAAGFSIGVCEWRPEKRGTNGSFEVAGKVSID